MEKLLKNPSLLSLHENRGKWRAQRDVAKVSEPGLNIPLSGQDCQFWFKHYAFEATLLKNSEVVNTLVEKIKHHYTESKVANDDDHRSSSFFSVGAPSGSGKTQLAFTLAESASLDVLHICLTDEPESSQEIYRHDSIHEASKLFRLAVRDDFVMLQNLENCTASSLLEEGGPELCTVALLSSSFGIKSTQDRIITSARQLREAVHAFVASSGTFPVVVIDEAFQHIAAQDNSSLDIMSDLHISLYLRSVLRATGIASLFMGTTINMVQFVLQGVNVSTSSEKPRPWTQFISRLPPLMTGSASDVLRRVFPAWTDSSEPFHSANPRLMQHLIDSVARSNLNLEAALSNVARLTYLKKRILRTTDGLRGQVLYMLNSTGPEPRTPALVTAHFARFEKDEEVMVEAQQPCVASAEPPSYTKPWEPVPDFPNCEEDPILPLIMGGPCDARLHPAPFVVLLQKRKYELTSAAAFLLCKSLADSSNRFHSIPMSNSKAKHRDGDVTECIVALATVNASRANGLAGVLAADYLLAMIREMQASGVPLTWQDNALWDFWSNADNTTIPYVARLDDQFPATLLPSVGRLQRTANADRMDLSLTSGDKKVLFLECKHLQNKPFAPATTGSGGAEINTVCEVLLRFNTNGRDSNLGVVVVSRLANLQNDSNVDAEQLKETCLVHIQVVESGSNSRVSVVRIASSVKDAVEQHEVNKPKPRMLCFIECDEETIRRSLATETPLARAFKLS